MTDQNFNITENAAKRLLTLREKQGGQSLMFRVTVLGGGCSGFQYKFDFDATKNDDDLAFEKDGMTVVTDTISMEYLNNATLDFVEELGGSLFKVTNPNADAACGCGNSFSVKL